MAQQIILRDLQRPKKANIDEDIGWLGSSLGFVSRKDTAHMMRQILKRVLTGIAEEEGISTERLARELNIAIQRVNYHVRCLVDAGFLYRRKKRIFLRQGSVRAAVEEIRKDANRMFDNLLVIADDIDRSLGLKNRNRLR